MNNIAFRIAGYIDEKIEIDPSFNWQKTSESADLFFLIADLKNEANKKNSAKIPNILKNLAHAAEEVLNMIRLKNIEEKRSAA